MLIKNEIPILEYDTSQQSVIMPDHEGLTGNFPKKAVFAFLNEVFYDFMARHGAEPISVFESMTRDFLVYRLNWRGEELCFCQAPVGSAPSACVLDFLYAYGVEEVIAVGSCGTLTDLPENELLIPEEALRDEGASYHYLPAARTVVLNREMINKMERELTRQGCRYERVKTWTTDAFYRETKDLVAYRISEGCRVVEMECAALAAVAEFRGKRFGQILFTADSLADVENHDMRRFGKDSHEIVLRLAIEALRGE